MPAERSPLWGQLPSVVDPTAEELGRIRRGIDERLRKRAATDAGGCVLIPGVIARARDPVVVARVEGSARRARSRAPNGPSIVPLDRGSVSSFSAQTPAAPQILAPEAPLAAPVAAAAPRLQRHTTAAPRLPVRPEADDPEAALLGSALRQLRREHNPRGALSVLKSYQEEFPAGILRPEAVLVEAESLVALGKHQELVNLLTPEAVSEAPRSTELSLLRAEALSHLDRCREAIPVFSSLLATTLEDEPVQTSSLAERALFGRALCRIRVGQVAAARHDLELEASQFPDEAAKARQTLESLP